MILPSFVLTSLLAAGLNVGSPDAGRPAQQKIVLRLYP